VSDMATVCVCDRRLVRNGENLHLSVGQCER
jgi:hypothetical protein